MGAVLRSAEMSATSAVSYSSQANYQPTRSQASHFKSKSNLILFLDTKKACRQFFGYCIIPALPVPSCEAMFWHLSLYFCHCICRIDKTKQNRDCLKLSALKMSSLSWISDVLVDEGSENGFSLWQYFQTIEASRVFIPLVDMKYFSSRDDVVEFQQ